MDIVSNNSKNRMSSDKSKIHFVLVAGYSADEQEAAVLKENLAKQGFSADAISFYGEKYINDFTDLKISDCIKNISGLINKRAEEYENVFGIGISLGGALLLEHAKKKSNLKGIASIGTPFRLSNVRWIKFGQLFLPLFYFVWRQLQKIKRLRLSPLGATKIVVDYLEKDLPINLATIQAPVLLLHSKKDPVSDYRVLPGYLDQIASGKKKIIFFEKGNHVIAHDADLLMRYSLDFFEIER